MSKSGFEPLLDVRAYSGRGHVDRPPAAEKLLEAPDVYPCFADGAFPVQLVIAHDQCGELLERHLVGAREERATPSDVPFALLEHALGFGFARHTDRGAHSPVRPGVVELPRVGTTTLFP